MCPQGHLLPTPVPPAATGGTGDGGGGDRRGTGRSSSLRSLFSSHSVQSVELKPWPRPLCRDSSEVGTRAPRGPHSSNLPDNTPCWLPSCFRLMSPSPLVFSGILSQIKHLHSNPGPRPAARRPHRGTPERQTPLSASWSVGARRSWLQGQSYCVP